VAKLDPALKFLVDQKKPALQALALEAEFQVVAERGEDPRATVLVEFEGELEALEAAGFETNTVAGDVASGSITLKKLSALQEVEGLRRIEVSRAQYPELDLSVPEIRANVVHSGPPGNRGTGVVVGIIDSGIDYMHQAFRRGDGTSRILAIWDQGLTPNASEQNPTGFSYGVEYRKTDIDAALVNANPLSIVRHQDQIIPGVGAHGTHVAGIAAGDGSAAGGGMPAFTFVGVAPEADIVVVANNRGAATGERGLGDSADTLDAIRYIFDVAASLGRSAVINQSQGDNVGPHDGTSVLERGVDNLLGGQGRAMVKSAGNEGARNRHASGTVALGSPQVVPFTVPAGRTFPITIDLWYRGPDRMGVSLTPPGGAAIPAVAPGTTTTVTLPNGNQVFIDSDLNDPENHDNRIFLVITRNTLGAIAAGTWSLTLTGTAVSSGQWDAWLQRGEPSPQFLPPLRNPARTISVPGTAREVITVGSYVIRGAGVGSISSFSSMGPTRDGRQVPTVAAPGQTIMSAQPAATGDLYGLMPGTSMASPMVTGTVALMLQKSPRLTQAQIIECLQRTARSDAFTGATPNNAWGAGKVDVAAAFECAPGDISIRTIRPPCRTLRPPCERTIFPPCPDTRRPPCGFITDRPPCPQPTDRPPCVVFTDRPPCPQPTDRPPCGFITDRPPCPQPTDRPPCGFITDRPPCPQLTDRPPCPGPTTFRPPCFATGGPEATSGGWQPEPQGPVESWHDPVWWWSGEAGAESFEEGPVETGEAGGNGTGASDASYWYGSSGY
jgi:subtilisin family serine protease